MNGIVGNYSSLCEKATSSLLHKLGSSIAEAFAMLSRNVGKHFVADSKFTFIFVGHK